MGMSRLEKIESIEIPYKNTILKIPSFEGAIENEGRLSKIWVMDVKEHRQYLIKASGFYGYEPISEKLAYIIGSHIGFDVLKYDVIDAKYLKGILKVIPSCKYLSICERLDINGMSISCIRDIKNARNIGRPEGDKLLNRTVMMEILDKKYLDKLLIFDAIIGNMDRHYGNIHVLMHPDGRITGAPFMDNGASCLASHLTIETMVVNKKSSRVFDRSCTLEKKHRLQTANIESHIFKNIDVTKKILEIDGAMQDTLALLPKLRAKTVERYLIDRLYKYLTMFQ